MKVRIQNPDHEVLIKAAARRMGISQAQMVDEMIEMGAMFLAVLGVPGTSIEEKVAKIDAMLQESDGKFGRLIITFSQAWEAGKVPPESCA